MLLSMKRRRTCSDGKGIPLLLTLLTKPNVEITPIDRQDLGSPTWRTTIQAPRATGLGFRICVAADANPVDAGGGFLCCLSV
jgi:hypothetical protein